MRYRAIGDGAACAPRAARAAKEGVAELAYLALGVAAILAHFPLLAHKSSREDSASCETRRLIPQGRQQSLQ